MRKLWSRVVLRVWKLSANKRKKKIKLKRKFTQILSTRLCAMNNTNGIFCFALRQLIQLIEKFDAYHGQFLNLHSKHEKAVN